MKLSEIKCGDEVFYNGEPHIAIEDGRKTGTRGQAATMATIWLTPTCGAGIDEEADRLEFGYRGGAPRDVDDEDVPVLRTGVEFHLSSHQSVRQADGTLACERTNHTTAEAAASELHHQKLLRDARAAADAQADIMFRTAVRNALDKQISVADIQRETGLSRARIYQIRDNRR